ncbi:MAG: Nicotinamide-nucleotide amidohydrolase PncC [SAR116 cluster bacterium MED-G04]|jgi:nicotinamide-nucleotide amidase|nr:MAG: Nicotinamide-nucleotide amidohydrolase PncC [SAR116 cluster bacterium MED-G04]HCV62313.1 damage-inducible protein CinA [Alphaproteobacteria bacterium]|tara:strand:+ start:707 stop:1195 length:489 start_codon:yes stop_codon:yes gene_type:complete
MNPIAAMIIEQATASRVMIAAAESCTGGMVAAALTDIPGSSMVLDRGFVTYSNTAKAEMLGVDPAIISHHGAVSEEVVRAMAAGALNSIAHSGSKLAVSVSGVAGPGGGSDEKPVGLVWFGIAGQAGNRLSLEAEQVIFPGDRGQIRQKAADHALQLLLDRL